MADRRSKRQSSPSDSAKRKCKSPSTSRPASAAAVPLPKGTLAAPSKTVKRKSSSIVSAASAASTSASGSGPPAKVSVPSSSGTPLRVQVQFPDGKHSWVAIDQTSGGHQQEAAEPNTRASCQSSVSGSYRKLVSMHESPVGPGASGDSRLVTTSDGQTNLPGVSGSILNPNFSAGSRPVLPFCHGDDCVRTEVEATRPDRGAELGHSAELRGLLADSPDILKSLVSALVPAVSEALSALTSGRGTTPASGRGRTTNADYKASLLPVPVQASAPVPGCSWWQLPGSPHASGSGSPARSRTGSDPDPQHNDNDVFDAEPDASPATRQWEDSASVPVDEKSSPDLKNESHDSSCNSILRQACIQAAKFFPEGLAPVEVLRPEAKSFLAGTLSSPASGSTNWAFKESPLVDLFLGRAFNAIRGLGSSAPATVTSTSMEAVPQYPKARKLGSFVPPPKSTLPFRKWVARRVLPEAPLPVSHDDRALLRQQQAQLPQAVSFPVKGVLDTEDALLRSLEISSVADVMLATLAKLLFAESDPDNPSPLEFRSDVEPDQVRDVFQALNLVVSRGCETSASAYANLILARRDAFLSSNPRLPVPLVQSLRVGPLSNSLFGPYASNAAKCDTERTQAELFASWAAAEQRVSARPSARRGPSTRPGGRGTRGLPRSASGGERPPQQGSAQPPFRGRGRGRSRGSSRGRSRGFPKNQAPQ